MFQKGFALIEFLFVIIILAAVITIVFLLGSNSPTPPIVKSPTPKPTAILSPIPSQSTEQTGWEVLENPTVGYRIPYPSTLTLRKENADKTLYMLLRGSSFIEIQSKIRFDLSPGQSMENYLETTPGWTGDYEQIDINGKTAYYLKCCISDGGSYLLIQDQKENKYLTIAINGFTLEEILPILEKLEFTTE